ncbi:MAG: 50S ribosomal protein L6 [Candidatus Buchananbacteria bacterium]
MSRIGKKIITLPAGVTANLLGQELKFKGPKGELFLMLHPDIKVNLTDKEITTSVLAAGEKKQRALWGLFGSLINNAVIGVSKGYEKKLEINGIGYKAQLAGNKMILNLGFSHPVEFMLPAGLVALVEKNIITLTSPDKDLLGQTAANIRALKKPEPYKGKGIKYADEILRKKAGKAAKAVGAK